MSVSAIQGLTLWRIGSNHLKPLGDRVYGAFQINGVLDFRFRQISFFWLVEGDFSMFKAMIVSVAMLFAPNALASVVELDPGGRLTIGDTTVVCKSNEDQVLKTFCNCASIGPQYMVNLDFVVLTTAGVRTTTLLGSYNDIPACERALATKDFCD